MKNALIIGILAAVATGSAIGLQASLGSRIGSVITPLRTGLWMNLVGGLIAGTLIVLFRNQEQISGRIPGTVIPMLIIAGALGVSIIVGVSFSLARTGVAAGLAGLFLGQMLVGLVVDTFGWGSIQPVPLDGRRLLGLLVMALAVFLLLPKE
jgi:transporter family-2 protein